MFFLFFIKFNHDVAGSGSFISNFILWSAIFFLVEKNTLLFSNWIESITGLTMKKNVAVVTKVGFSWMGKWNLVGEDEDEGGGGDKSKF